MFSIILFVHIIAAILLVGISIYALINKNKERAYMYVLAVAYGVLFELITGALLNMLSVEQQLLRYCENIVLYISVALVVELVLFTKLNGSHMPTRQVVWTFASGVIIAVLGAFVQIG